MAETKLCLNLLGPLLIGLPPGGCISYPGLGFLSGNRKVHHAQKWSERNLKVGLCKSLPFLGMATFSTFLRCVDQEAVREVESEIFLS